MEVLKRYFIPVLAILFILAEAITYQVIDSPLKALTPEYYRYLEAERCSACKNQEEAFMLRAAGIDYTSGKAVPDERGWINSVHARSQSHDDTINTACAWCHAPTAAGATKDKQVAEPIPKGTWQGVSCGACHPGSVPREQRASLLSNFTPGTEPSDPRNYVFRDRGNGKDMNAQCRFCHHKSHDLLITSKQELLNDGVLRCIDCHMSAYAVSNGHIERFHNFKVEVNIPHSCSGGIGRAMSCHESKSKKWFKSQIDAVKGPRKEWSDE